MSAQKTRSNPTAVANRTAETLAGKTPEPAKVVETEAAFTWDDLPPEEVATYVRVRVLRDVEAETPASIKARVASGFEATAKAGQNAWFMQNCGTAAQAHEYLKLARAYAAFKGMTLRGAVVVKHRDEKGTPDEWEPIVRYAVKRKENRSGKK